MAQFDYYRQQDGRGFWLDCQTGLMQHYQTRFVVPLVPIDEAPRPSALPLNPRFEIAGGEYEMLTQFAGTIPDVELDQPVGSLEAQRYAITNALDFLITGV